MYHVIPIKPALSRMCMEKSPINQKKSDYIEKLKVLHVSQGNDRTRKSEMGSNVIA